MLNVNSSELDFYRGNIEIVDLNREWFEDKDLAENAYEDCLQLFKTTEGDFDAVRSQPWYKRIWATLSSGNTRQLAKGCTNLAQAQQLLLSVLQAHAQMSNKSNVLMTMLARGLRNQEGTVNQIVTTIIDMGDRVEIIEEEVELHRRQMVIDPSNPYTWNQEQKLVLYKVMVAAANADGNIDTKEQALLDLKSKQFRLKDEYYDEAIEFLNKPHSLDEEIELVDSYKMRLNMFKSALGLVYSDGIFDDKEKQFISKLASTLNIRERDRDKYTDKFSSITKDMTIEKIDKKIFNKRNRSISAPDKKDYDKIDSRKAERQQADEQRKLAMLEIKNKIKEIGPQWSKYATAFVLYCLLRSAYTQLEEFSEIIDDENAEFEDIIDSLNSDTILEGTNEDIEIAGQFAGEFFGDIDKILSFHPSIFHEFKTSFEKVISDDGNWEQAIYDLQETGERVIDEKPSGIGNIFKSAVAGGASGILFGPAGIIIGGAAGYLISIKSNKRFEEAFDQWIVAASRFEEACDRWQENAQRRLQQIFDKVVDTTIETVDQINDPNTAEKVIQLLIDDMSDDDDNN